MTASADRSPNLSQAEIDEICEPLTQPAAQVRYLCSLGLTVKRKPNGRALIARAEYERAMVSGQLASSAPAASVPTADVIALRQRWASRGRNGSASSGR